MLFMRSDPSIRALRDMAYHIDLAESFAAGVDFGTFRDDLRMVYAVTRCLEIISEASRRLPDELKHGIRGSHGRRWPGPATATTMRT